MMNLQDPSIYQQQQQQIKPPQFPEQQEHLKCPRCDSNNTKFCYYNNYNLSQPRHYCKNCRRYWTKGGSLRNIPVGGGTRKNNTKKSSVPRRHSLNSSSSTSVITNSTTNSSSTPNAMNSVLKPESNSIFGAPIHQESRVLDVSGSFSSLLGSSGQFGNFLAGFDPINGVRASQIGEFTQSLNSDTGLGLDMGRNLPESFLELQTGASSCWNGDDGSSNGWPDLAI